MRPFLVGILLFAASPLAAQSRPIGPAPSALFAPAATPSTRALVLHTDVGASRQWGRSGLAIGAAVGTATAFAVWGGSENSTCEDVECVSEAPTSAYFLIFPAAAAGLGYLIGSTAGENVPGPEPGDADRGLNWWQGGLIGSAIGSLAGILVAKPLAGGSDCPDCSSATKGEYQAAGVGGAAIGFLLGARVASVR